MASSAVLSFCMDHHCFPSATVCVSSVSWVSPDTQKIFEDVHCQGVDGKEWGEEWTVEAWWSWSPKVIEVWVLIPVPQEEKLPSMYYMPNICYVPQTVWFPSSSCILFVRPPLSNMPHSSPARSGSELKRQDYSYGWRTTQIPMAGSVIQLSGTQLGQNLQKYMKVNRET